MPSVRLIRNKLLEVYEVEILNGHEKAGLVRKVIIKTNEGPLLLRDAGRELLHVSELSPMLWELDNRLKTAAVCRVRIDCFVSIDDKGNERIGYVENRQLDAMEFVDRSDATGDEVSGK